MRSASFTAAPFIPPVLSLPGLRQAAARCEGCPLYRTATQTVFGEGPRSAMIVLIGEQPGDREDLEGRPFVGPAGRLLEQALNDAGIDRRAVYVTNAVKHFKFETRGKRRIHQKPGALEILACRPWLDAEIAVIRPRMVVCLGATAAQSMMGRGFRVTRERGLILPFRDGATLMATVHPSSLLRIADGERRKAEYGRFVDDLRQVRGIAARPGPASVED